MHKRPFLLFLSSLLFLYFPAELFFHVLKGLKVSPAEWFLSGVFPILLFVGLLKVLKLGWYTLVGLVTLWGMRDLYQYYADQKSILPFLTHILIYGVSLTYFINPRIKHLYFDPKARWWRTKPRYETHHAVILLQGKQAYYPILRNISEGGCFLEMGEKLVLTEKVELVFPLPIPLGQSIFRSEGEVRWVSTHPEHPGVGIQFQNTLKKEERALKEFVLQQL